MKKQQTTIALIGKKGSGKSMAAEYLQKQYGAKLIRFSFFIEEMLAVLRLPIKDRNLQIKLIEKLRAFLGEDILARIMVQNIQKINHPLIVLDGMRFLSEEKFLRTHCENFFTLTISASSKIRYLRTKKRGEKTNEKTFTYQQFLNEEKRSTERGIAALMKRADLALDNSKDEQKLFRQLDAVITRTR